MDKAKFEELSKKFETFDVDLIEYERKLRAFTKQAYFYQKLIESEKGYVFKAILIRDFIAAFKTSFDIFLMKDEEMNEFIHFFNNKYNIANHIAITEGKNVSYKDVSGSFDKDGEFVISAPFE